MNPLEYRIALRNLGNQDLSDSFDYKGLTQARAMTPPMLIEELRKSQLRGRGGAGFVTADKWQAMCDAEGNDKYVICNAVDGDVRSMAAQVILENDPYSVLEGMAIAAYGVGASQYIVAVADGEQGVVDALEKAINHLRSNGHLADSAIEIRQVPRSLIAGEETALMRALTGRQAMSVLRPPFPSECGYDGKPTLVENVETFANVSAIFHKGADWFQSIGTAQSKGSKVVTLSGAVNKPCLIEVPFGTPLIKIIEDIGETSRDSIKAVQVGGPTGTYIGAAELDMPLSFEALSEIGGIIGSGSIDVIVEPTCAVEMTHRLMTFLHNESCGKCVFCREGTLHLADMLSDIVQGEAKMPDLDLLLELAGEMKIGAICGLGKSAPNPVVSSIRLFRPEFEAHIRYKKCPKGNIS
jgi:NADH:ubiquinone oxidoreductase subunit F (NADH-binding)